MESENTPAQKEPTSKRRSRMPKLRSEDNKLDESNPRSSFIPIPATMTPRSLESVQMESSDKLDSSRQNLDQSSSKLNEASEPEHKRSLLDRTVDMFTLKQKRNQHHQSMELLTSSQIASKHKPVFEEGGPKSDIEKQVRSSSILSGSVRASHFELNSSSPVNYLSVRTGYKPQKVGSPAEPLSPRGKEELLFLKHHYRSAGMLQSNPVLTYNPIPSSKLATAKTFRDWYLLMLNAHDDRKKSCIFDKTAVPLEFSVEMLFGSNTDDLDPFERIAWITDCFEKVYNDLKWAEFKTKSPSSLQSRINPPNLVKCHIQTNGIVEDQEMLEGIKAVSEGKIQQLLERLFFPTEQDSLYPEIFLSSYRFLITAHELFDYLLQLYNYDAGDPKDKVKQTTADAQTAKNKEALEIRCQRILLLWVNNHWIDFQRDPSLVEKLDKFVDGLAKDSFNTNQTFVHAVREQRLTWYTYQFIPMFSGGKINGETGKPIHTEWDVDSFAHNLTYIDYLMFRRLNPDIYYQLLARPVQVEGGGFSVPLKLILETFHWFQMIVGYVGNRLATEDNTKKRILLLKMFVKTASACLTLKNYSGAFAIITGLRMPVALMWSTTWEALPNKFFERYKEMLTLIDPEDNFRNYFEAIKGEEPPAVPFLRIYLLISVPYVKDLLNIHQNEKMFKNEEPKFEDMVVNFKRFYKMHMVSSGLENFRLSSYGKILMTDKDSSISFLHHIRSLSLYSPDGLGTSMCFADGVIPDGNPNLNTPHAMKAMRKVVQFLEMSKDPDTASKSSLNKDDRSIA